MNDPATQVEDSPNQALLPDESSPSDSVQRVQEENEDLYPSLAFRTRTPLEMMRAIEMSFGYLLFLGFMVALSSASVVWWFFLDSDDGVQRSLYYTIEAIISLCLFLEIALRLYILRYQYLHDSVRIPCLFHLETISSVPLSLTRTSTWTRMSLFSGGSGRPCPRCDVHRDVHCVRNRTDPF